MAVFTGGYISLFSGVAGLDLGIRIAFPQTRCLGYVEINVEAAEILAARIEEGSLDDAPVWSDVATFPAELYRGRISGVVGGFPCQDLSVAGKRAGLAGKRSGLWGEYQRIIRETKPVWVFIENVGGLLSSTTLLHRSDIVGHLEGLLLAAAVAPTPRDRWHIERHHERLYRRLLATYGISALLYVECCLEEMGYQCQAGLFTAAEVGASHKRERVFILGYRTVADVERARLDGSAGRRSLPDRSPLQAARPVHEYGKLAFAASGRLGVSGESSGSNGFADGGDAKLGDATSYDERRNTDRAYGPGLAPGRSGGVMADTPRDERDRPHGQVRARRRIREASDGVADTERKDSGRQSDASLRKPVERATANGDGSTVADAGDGLFPIKGRRPGRRDGTRPAGPSLENNDDQRRWSGVSDAESGPGFGRGEPGSGRSYLGHTDEPGLQRRSEREHSANQRITRPAGDSGIHDVACESACGRSCDCRLANAFSERVRSGPGDDRSQTAAGVIEGPERERIRPDAFPTGGQLDDTVRGRRHDDSGVTPIADRDRQDDRVSEPTSTEFPLFAPGPGATAVWQDLLVRAPWLRPAWASSEAESIFRGTFDGDHTRLDIEHRTDRLRAVGNMVSPLQAAFALTVLARRAGLI